MALWGHRHLVPTLGIGEEMGPLPGLPPLMQQDLAQVQLLPWPWLKSRQDRRAMFNSTVSRRKPRRKSNVRAISRKPKRKSKVRVTSRKSKRKRKVRVNSASSAKSSVV